MEKYCKCADKLDTIRTYYTNFQCKTELINYFILDIVNIIFDYLEQLNPCKECLDAVTHVSQSGLIITYFIRDPTTPCWIYRLEHKVLFLTKQSYSRDNQHPTSEIKENLRPQIMRPLESQFHMSKYRKETKKNKNPKKILKNQRSKKLFKITRNNIKNDISLQEDDIQEDDIQEDIKYDDPSDDDVWMHWGCKIRHGCPCCTNIS